MDSRPSRDEVLMEHARVASLRGTCSRLQVGVVIARTGRILVSGYNGAPAGMEHCEHTFDLEGGCAVAVHAEANAIAYAARYGIRIEQAELYSTDSPCVACAQLIINAGISRVIYGRAYRDPEGLHLLLRARISVWGSDIMGIDANT